MARGPRVGGLPRRQTQAVQPVVEWSKRQMVNAQRSNAPNRKAQAVEPGGHVGHEDQDRHRQPHLADVLGQRGQLQLPGGGGRRGERRAAVTWSRAPLGRTPPPIPPGARAGRRPREPATRRIRGAGFSADSDSEGPAAQSDGKAIAQSIRAGRGQRAGWPLRRRPGRPARGGRPGGGGRPAAACWGARRPARPGFFPTRRPGRRR